MMRPWQKKIPWMLWKFYSMGCRAEHQEARGTTLFWKTSTTTPEEATEEYYRQVFHETPKIEVFRHFKAVAIEKDPELISLLPHGD